MLSKIGGLRRNIFLASWHWRRRPRLLKLPTVCLWRGCEFRTLAEREYTVSWSVFSPGQTDSKVDTSRHKFAKPELVYGLAKVGQTDLQVHSQVAKIHNSTQQYKWLLFNLYGFVLGGQMLKNWHRLACEFELVQSQRQLSQVHVSPHK